MGSAQKEKGQRRVKNRQAGWFLFFGFASVIVIVLAILYFTLFKPKDPKVEVNSVQLLSIYLGGFPATINSVNVSLNLVVMVDNPNRATFHHSGSTAYLYFYGAEAGFSFIPAGEIEAQTSVQLTVYLTVGSSNFIQGPLLKADVETGVLPLSTTATIKGHVTTLNMFSHHAVTTSKCNLNVSLSTRAIEDYSCKNSISL